MNGARTGAELTTQTATIAPPAVAPPRALIDYDFQSVLAAPPRQRLVLWLMVGLLGAVALALSIAQVDIVISANGRIVTSDAEIVVQPLETSIVRAVLVKMGQRVKAGQVLARLDPTFTGADENELSFRLRSLEATYDRLDAELAGRPYDPASPNEDQATQRDIFRKRHDEYAARLLAMDRKAGEYRADLASHEIEANGLGEQIRLAKEAEDIYATLVASALASKLKLIETMARLIEAKSRLDTNLGEQEKLKHQIAEIGAERDAFIQEWNRKLAEELAQTRGERDSFAARLSKARLRHVMSVLTAPRDATVLEVAPRPSGSVVREAEPLIRLVPSDTTLVAEVQVDTRDVAWLHLGDPVTVKLEALPWQQYGLVHGVLKTLTPDTLEDRNPRQTSEDMANPDLKPQARQSPIHYRAQITLTDTKFRNLPADFELRPGMRLVGDIKVGRRSVLDYVLNPITGLISETLREP